MSDFEESLDISQPNVSQHLSLLRTNGIIDFFIDGRLKCYFLKEPLIPDLLDLLKKEYEDDMPAPACCPVTKKGPIPGREGDRALVIYNTEWRIDNHGNQTHPTFQLRRLSGKVQPC